MYSEGRDCQKNASDADEQPGRIDQKCGGCFSKSVDGADQGSIRIQKRADPCKSEKEIARRAAVEEYVSDEASEHQKKETAGQPEDQAAPDSFLKELYDARTASGGLGGADRGHEHGSYGAGECRRKEDAGHGHAGEDSVQTQGLAAAQPIEL